MPSRRASAASEPGERVERFEVGSAEDDADSGGRARLDRWLAERLTLSRTQIATLIDQGRVTVGGRPVKKSYLPEPGDTVVVRIPPPPPTRVEPEDLSGVEVRYEDPELAVVVKPAGMVVHPAPGHPSGTLVNALLHRLGGLSSVGAPLRPGIVHRLDRDTSGLLVVARRDGAHRALAEALARRRVRRGYIAASWGHLEMEGLDRSGPHGLSGSDRGREGARGSRADRGGAERSGPEGRAATVDLPIGRDPKNRKRMAVVEGGRRAVTRLRRLERWRSADLLAIRLHTGRTHQIRVHLRHLGHPVVNDPIYGPGWERGFVGAGGHWAEELARRAGRLFLHAAWLSFRHPSTGKRLSFRSELPEPLASAVAWARESSGAEPPRGGP